MNNLFFGCWIAWLVSAGLSGQNFDRIYKSYLDAGDHLEVTTHDGHYRVKFFSGNIIETTFVPVGESVDLFSQTVIMRPEKVKTALTEDGNQILYETEGISAVITKSPFSIAYFFGAKELISEKAGYREGAGMREIEFNLSPEEVLYGGGTRVLGMNRRGHRLELYNRAHYGYTTHSELMNYCIPMVVSSKQYAIYFDNPQKGFLDLDSRNDNTLRFEAPGGRMTYQVIAGDCWPDLVDHITQLTGRQPLPPRWVFGNFSSRFGYHSEQETRMTVEKFLEDSIPLDAVVIDIYWFGPEIFGYMGNLEFWADSFPSPDQMMADFRARGIKTVLVTEPFILTTSDRWQEAVDAGILGTDSAGNPFTYDFYFGNTGLIDIFKPEAREWFWNIYRQLTLRGAGGWWGDLGEPEVHPSGLHHQAGKADELHNVYGHEWAKLIYQGYARDFPEQRPFILMRSGAAGSQHYGMIPWTGDVDRSWGGLKPQNELSLQMGLQGIAYLHSDLGGFAGGEVFDPELYTRWLQYGVFQPLFRPHAQEHIPSEPVFHDAKTKALAKQAICLRYSLLPYNYTLAFENNQSGMPFMRPLFFEEPDNEKLLAFTEEYLWGNDFLIAPVTSPEDSVLQVYFPAGSNWFDFFGKSRFDGGTVAQVKLSEEHIPVYVRGGAVIPMAGPMQYTEQYTGEELQLHCWYDPERNTSIGRVYQDDGITPYAYEKGAYELLDLQVKNEEKEWILTIRDETGTAWQPAKKSIHLIIHHYPEAPNQVLINGAEAEFQYSSGEYKLSIPLEKSPGLDCRVVVN